MLLIFIRTIIIFTILFLVIRLMGKRQIGEMQPFEFVITILISELASIPMADLSIPIGYGIIAILSMFVLHQLLAILEKKSVVLGRLISSKPSIVIDSNGINFSELKKLNISINELQENLRNNGYSNFDDIAYALIETNGKFSLIEKQKDKNKPEPPNTPLPICIIEEGKYKDWELKETGTSKEFFDKIFEREGIKDIKKIMVATIDNNGKIYYQCETGGYKVIEDVKGGRKW